MNSTLKTLSQIIIPEYQKMSLEQLAEAYTEDLNPCILASAFSKTFKLIISISKKFFGFSEADIASFSLETLDKCLQTYLPGNATFVTYYTTFFKNRLRQESESLSTDKRKVCLYSDSLNVMMENGFDVVANVKCTSEDTLHYLASLGLTPKELDYCSLLMNGYTNKEISEIFDTSVMTLCNMRKRLRTKLTPFLLHFD